MTEHNTLGLTADEETALGTMMERLADAEIPRGKRPILLVFTLPERFAGLLEASAESLGVKMTDMAVGMIMSGLQKMADGSDVVAGAGAALGVRGPVPDPEDDPANGIPA